MTAESADLLRGMAIGVATVFVLLWCFDAVFTAGRRYERSMHHMTPPPQDVFTDARSTTPASPKLEDFEK